MRDESRERWAGYDAASIPTKSDLTPLESFLGRLRDRGARGGALLDLGCGTGVVSERLAARGFDVLGVDINPEAIARARETVAGAAFEVGDIASPAGLELGGRTFAVVVCQLVVSVVGRPESRRALTKNAFERLAPGGDFYLSASGLSATINPDYARLYELDFPETGEWGTYLSRDGEGNVLYETHHFEVDELRELLESTGFAEVSVERRRETSSRRPGEAAYFLYAHGRRPKA